MSGDSDYVDLVKHLKSEGVRIEVAAVKANTASILLNETDYFHEITKKDVFRLPGAKRSSFQRHNQRTQNTQQQNSQNKSQQNVKKPSQPIATSSPAQSKQTPARTSQPIATEPMVNTVPSKDNKKPLPVKAAKKATKKATKKTAKKATKKAAKKTTKKEAKKSIASKIASIISSK